MHSKRMSFLLITALVLPAAMLQAADTKPAAAKAPPILEQLPAGAMGFVVVSDVHGLFTNVQEYMRQIGLGEVLDSMGGDLLPMVEGQAKLGEGFNPNGGFAVAMLDPQAFGVDVPGMIGSKEKATSPAEKPKLPLVIFVPATSIKEAFGAYPMEEKAPYTLITFRMGPMFAAQIPGYVLLSPMSKALDAVLAGKKVSTELTKEVAAVLQQEDLAVYLNMKMASPLYLKILEQVASDEGGMMPAEMAKLVKDTILPFYKQVLPQFQTLLLGGRFTKSALIFEEYATAIPDSSIGKLIASIPATDKPLLDRLPNLPYVLALGGVGNGQTPSADERKFVDSLLSAVPASAEANTAKDQARQTLSAFQEQLTQAQIVAGGAPAGSGVVGVAAVLQCKDAAKVKTLVAQIAQAVVALIKASDPKDESLQKLAVTFKSEAEKADSLPVDTLEIQPPAPMDDQDRANMAKIISDDKLLIRMASPDATTVVITFGGGKAYLAETLKTAKDGGSILKDPAVVEALKVTPAKKSKLFLFNVSNLWEVVTKGTTAMGSGESVPPLSFTGKDPIVVSVTFEEATAHIQGSIPNSLVKDAVGMVMQMFMGGMTGPGPGAGAPAKSKPTQKGNDF